MSAENHCSCAQVNEDELYPELEELIAQHNGKPTELIMALHKAQNLFGYLPKKAQEFISEKLNVPISTICGVISFYSFFSTVPKAVSYTHLRAHETVLDLVCRLLLEKKKKIITKNYLSGSRI